MATVTCHLRPTAGSGQDLTPGSGTNDEETATQVGEGTGADENAIAGFDFVPHQTYAAAFKIGVVAWHINGIHDVSFQADGGTVVTVSTPSANSTSGVTEYWVSLATIATDGPVEIQAVVTPNVGTTRVLTTTLVSNANGDYDGVAKYVATTGNDSTGDGSEGNPYLTISKAANVAAVANGSADGCTVYLKAGNYQWAGSATPNITTTDTYIIITAAPGVAATDVSLNSRNYDNTLKCKYICFRGITLATELAADNNIQRVAWADQCLGAAGYVIELSASFPGGVYYTDCDVDGATDGFHSASLCRNCTATNIAEDAYRSQIIINCTASNVQEVYLGVHADIVQYGSAPSNCIIYGLTVTGTNHAQGVSNAGDFRDFAMIDVDFSGLVEDNSNIMAEYDWRHALISNCQFGFTVFWSTDEDPPVQFSATNVVVEDSTADVYEPAAPAGVTYR